MAVVARAALHPRHLGPVLLGDGARACGSPRAVSPRPARSSITSSSSHARGAELARAGARRGTTRLRAAQRAPRRARRVGAPSPRRSRATFTSCPTTTATARPRADPTLRGMVSRPQARRQRRLARAPVPRDDPGHRPRHAPHHRDDERRTAIRITTLLACGGDTKNPVFLREHADVTGCRIVLPARARGRAPRRGHPRRRRSRRSAERARRRWRR